MAHLTTINQQLTTTNTNISAQLKISLTTNATLVAQLQPLAGTTTRATKNVSSSGHNLCPAFDWDAWVASLDPMGYCWSHGYKVVNGHNSVNCKGKLMDHIDTATNDYSQGGITRGKSNWLVREVADITEANRHNLANIISQTPTLLSSSTIADTGGTAHYLRPSDPHHHTGGTKLPIMVGLTNSNRLSSNDIACDIDLPQLPTSARTAHFISGITHSYILSTGQLCDAGCKAIKKNYRLPLPIKTATSYFKEPVKLTQASDASL